MKGHWRSLGIPLFGGLAAALALSPAPALALPFVAQTTFGAAGDEVGAGVAASGSGVYFSGSAAAGQGVVGQFSSSLAPAPVWSRSWPGPSDGAFFDGVALTSSGVVAAGRSYINTVDTVGDKEGKGVTVKFNADGSAGGGVGGAVWSRQTPAAPGGFPYGGHEWLTAVTEASESGQTRLYTAGIGERFGFTSEWGLFVTKLDDSGNILWSGNDFAPTNAHNTPSIITTDNGVYVASRNDTSGIHPYLKRYDQDGNLVWSRTSAASGEYLGVASAGGKVYAVGQTNPETANPDFLIESWDDAGNLLWSKVYDRSSAEDILNGVVFQGGHLFAVGSTKGGTAGGTDGVLLEIDALTGNLIDSTLWGGAADDSFNGLAIAGSRLYAVGATRSFGAGGNDVALASFALPADSVPEPATLLVTAFGMSGLALTRRREMRRGFWPR